jgi:hypothetical protein
MTIDYFYSSQYQQDKSDILDRAVLDFSTVNVPVVEGGKVTWVITGTVPSASAIVVRTYDSGRYGEYHQGAMLVDPHVIIKCATNCVSNNVSVMDVDSNVLYTFDTDCTTIPKYCVLRLTDSPTRAWELA